MKCNSQAHYAKGTPSSHKGTPTACKRMVSGTISLRCSRFFSPFLHSTCSLSVSWKYLALPDGPGEFRQDFTCPALLRILLQSNKVTPKGLSPALVQLSRWFCLFVQFKKQSYNPTFAETNLVQACSRSLATTKEITFVFFSSRYLDVSVPRVRPYYQVMCLQHTGLPHSEIHGSKVICTYPRLIAAYHVLLRLQEPRHPPYALTILSFVFSRFYSIPSCQRTLLIVN